jgi:DNA-directed RNA polymerase subunit L
MSTLTLKRGDPWFPDGNLILASEDHTAFKVHRGILARHSEIFQGMFDIPHPELLSESEVYEGCPIITMYDKGIELANLVKALYDGA